LLCVQPGVHNKEYNIDIHRNATCQEYQVIGRYGRIGGKKLTSVVKYVGPSRHEAFSVYNKLRHEKLRDGYYTAEVGPLGVDGTQPVIEPVMTSPNKIKAKSKALNIVEFYDDAPRKISI